MSTPPSNRRLSRMLRIMSFLAAFVTVLSVIISSFYYIKDRPARTRDTIYAAWQIVASMEGKKGSGGREAAIAQLREYNEDLSGINLDSGVLKDLDLSNSHIWSASFNQAILSNSIFNCSHLVMPDFRKARLDKAQFIAASLHTAFLQETIMTDADLTQVKMNQCIADTSTTFNGSTFKDATICYSVFSGTNFDNTVFTNVNLIEVRMDKCHIRRAKLDSSVWRNVKASDADMSLSDANNISVGWSSNLEGSCLDQSNIRFARFENVNLARASFFNSDLTGTVFIDCNLSEVDFSSAILQNVEIKGSHIEGMTLSAASKSGLKISGCSGNLRSLIMKGMDK